MPSLRAHQEIATSVKQGESSVEDREELSAVSHFHRQDRNGLTRPSSQAFHKEEACSMEILTKKKLRRARRGEGTCQDYSENS